MELINELSLKLFLEGEGLSPNSYESTMKALSFVEEYPKVNNIADIGCGIGLQTVSLYEKFNKGITAIDFSEEIIRSFKKELTLQKLIKWIHPVLSSPKHLPFKEEELDLIWSEYIGGYWDFEWIIKEWNHYLKKYGHLGICAYCWLRNNPPQKLVQYWDYNDKKIASINSRIQHLQENGFSIAAHFAMPEICWWNYFCPLEVNFENFLSKCSNNIQAKTVIDKIDEDIKMFEQYGDYYGYVFFIAKKMI